MFRTAFFFFFAPSLPPPHPFPPLPAQTLTAHWAKVASTKDGHIVNKKLPVKHTVDPDSLSAPSNPKAGFGSVAAGKDAVREGMQKGKEGEGFTEDAVLRKK